MHAFESYKSVLLKIACFCEHELQEANKCRFKVKINVFMEASISSSLAESCVIIKSGIEPASPYNIKKSLPI
jgi:hypothetical protein